MSAPPASRARATSRGWAGARGEAVVGGQEAVEGEKEDEAGDDQQGQAVVAGEAGGLGPPGRVRYQLSRVSPRVVVGRMKSLKRMGRAGCSQ